MSVLRLYGTFLLAMSVLRLYGAFLSWFAPLLFLPHSQSLFHISRPKASNKNSANSHEKNHNERHIKALLLIRRAVHIEVTVRRTSLELEDPFFCILLHQGDHRNGDV